MREIAEVSGDFRKAYFEQQKMIAEWIMAQRAWKETATQLGIQVGKTPEELQKAATQNANAILEDRSEHGNNASSIPFRVCSKYSCYSQKERQSLALIGCPIKSTFRCFFVDFALESHMLISKGD